MIRLTLLGLLALASSCSDPMALRTEQLEKKPIQEVTTPNKGQIGPDNHLWEGKEWTRLNVNVRVREFSSYQDLAKAYKKGTGVSVPPGLTLYGYTTWPFYPDRNYCVVNIVDPDVDYRPEIVGHELFHCLHGNFHPNHLKRIGYEK